MTIDLKWGLPVVLPFAFVALIRAVSWFAGVPYENLEHGFIAGASLALGLVAGVILIMVLEDFGKKWKVTLWQKH